MGNRVWGGSRGLGFFWCRGIEWVIGCRSGLISGLAV